MKVKFTAYRTEAHLQNEKQVTDPFIVFPNGTVKTNTYFPADMYGYFLIQVRAEENVTRGLPFVANATLRVSVLLIFGVYVAFKNLSVISCWLAFHECFLNIPYISIHVHSLINAT